jgi:chromosomal replication initiation ATPase DnaA
MFAAGDTLVAGDIGPGQSLVVDDADRVAGNADAETALFHLHNLVLQGGGRLLMTARTPPRDWGLTLPDLASRMIATDPARLDPPDDALLSAVLVKLFADRQITVPPTLVAYLVTRMERSVAAAGALVAALDQLALATKSPITRNLAAELLDSADGE